MGANKKGRGSYSREFKEDAVRLVTEKGGQVSQVAIDLGIHENTIYKWVRLPILPARFPPRGGSSRRRRSCADFRGGNDILKEEREILKKALAIFSKHRA